MGLGFGLGFMAVTVVCVVMTIIIKKVPFLVQKKKGKTLLRLG